MAVKLIVESFTLKPEVCCSCEAFIIAKWTNQVLFRVKPTVFRYNKTHSTIFACATYNFIKYLPLVKIQIFGVSESTRPVCNHLHFNSIKTTLKTLFSSNIVIFAFLTKKLWWVRQQFRNTAKVLPIKMHISRKKIISIL